MTQQQEIELTTTRDAGVTMLPVTFDSEGSLLQGNLYLPPDPSPAPGIIVTGSWTTVKEQMAGLYAERLAERGFVALAFDFRNWGASEGNPRQYESPERKLRDIANAATFLKERPEVKPDSIGALAICASAGYLAHAVGRGAAIKSIALVASWLHDASTVPAIYGGDAGVARRLEAAKAARAQFEMTGTAPYVAAYDPNDPDAAMFFPLDYYGSNARGAVPEWTNRFAVMSWTDWLTFDAVSTAPGVRVPTLMVHADDAALPDNAKKFFAALPGPKHLFWTVGTQTDFYDREPQVGLAVDVAVAHFRHTLGAPAGNAPLADRQAVSDTVTRLMHAVDRQDWAAAREALGNEITTDYSSLFGGGARRQTAAEVIDGWRALLPGFDATQHMTGPVLADVSGDTARARCAVTAVHRLGSKYWTVIGHYDMTLSRARQSWRIAALTYQHVAILGDETLPEQARTHARD